MGAGGGHWFAANVGYITVIGKIHGVDSHFVKMWGKELPIIFSTEMI